MTALLNIIPLLVASVGIYLAWKGFNIECGDMTLEEYEKKRFKNTIIPILASFFVLYLYQTFHAGYVPTTGVAPLTRTEIYEEPSEIQDRLLKPEKTSEQRDKDWEESISWKRDAGYE